MAEAWPRAKDLRALTAADMNGQLETLRKQLWEQRIKAKDGALQQTHGLRLMRRQIARVQTVLREQARKTPGAQAQARRAR